MLQLLTLLSLPLIVLLTLPFIHLIGKRIFLVLSSVAFNSSSLVFEDEHVIISDASVDVHYSGDVNEEENNGYRKKDHSMFTKKEHSSRFMLAPPPLNVDAEVPEQCDGLSKCFLDERVGVRRSSRLKFKKSIYNLDFSSPKPLGRRRGRPSKVESLLTSHHKNPRLEQFSSTKALKCQIVETHGGHVRT